MEKLIMLIDIYEEEVVGVHSVGDKITDKEEARIVSKKFGFIKRLVDNDKINRDKVKRESKKNFVGDLEPRTPRYKLLILLSISNTPIEDLISYLK